jgi:hypothetical protein
MGRMTALGIVACMLLQGQGSAPAQEKNITVLFKGNLTTRLNPSAANPIATSQPQEFTNFYGTGIEIKYQFSSWNLAFGLSADYLRVFQASPLHVSDQTEVPTEDGYEAIPIEMTGYFLIPASGQTVRIFMGGGCGVYFGRRHYSIAGVEAPVTSSRPGFGIHVLGGVSYYFMNWLSLTAEMKFRDLQFRSTNAFSIPSISYQNLLFKIPQAPFESTVQTDGVIFQLGVGVSF